MTTGPTDGKSGTAAGGPGGMPLALKFNEGLGPNAEGVPVMAPEQMIEDLVRRLDAAQASERRMLAKISALTAAAQKDAEIERLRLALTEVRDRIRDHPAYADLTEAEEIDTGGDTAELSYLARVADAALGA